MRKTKSELLWGRSLSAQCGPTIPIALKDLVIISTNNHPPQVSLAVVVAVITVVSILLGIGFNTTNERVLFAMLMSPFYVILWILWLLLHGRRRLGIAYLVFHSIVALVVGGWVFSSTDGEQRWGRSLVLLHIDAPVTFWFLQWEPSYLFATLTILIGGGAFWCGVGYLIARTGSEREAV